MTNHIEKAQHTFLFGTPGHSDPDPAPQHGEPDRPLRWRPWFFFWLLVVVLFLGACAYVFFAWGLPLLMQIIEASGIRIA
jgi:hypothetical protein